MQLPTDEVLCLAGNRPAAGLGGWPSAPSVADLPCLMQNGLVVRLGRKCCVAANQVPLEQVVPITPYYTGRPGL